MRLVFHHMKEKKIDWGFQRELVALQQRLHTQAGTGMLEVPNYLAIS